MNKFGYFFDGESSVANYTLLYNRMEEEGCKIFEDKAVLEKTRPYWKLLVRELTPGDKVYVASLSNAFRGVREFVFFLIFCQQNDIILDSLEDDISTSCKDDHKVLSAIIKIVNSVKDARHNHSNSDGSMRSSMVNQSISIAKQKAEAELLNMYVAGYSADEIVRCSKYKSKATIYAILRKNGMEPERHKKTNKKREK